METTHAQARALRKLQTDAGQFYGRDSATARWQAANSAAQVPLLGYVTDFASLDAKLIIELDGGQHAEQVEADEKRTRALEAIGLIVLRFWNADIFTDLNGVLETIHATLKPEEYTIL